MHEKLLDAFVTKGQDQSYVLDGKDTYIGAVQSVRLESQGPEQPFDPKAIQVGSVPDTFVTPYPLDRNRIRAIITEDMTDWILPINQVLLRYGKRVLEQTGKVLDAATGELVPGGHWNRVTNGKGLPCLWSDLKVGDVIRVGTSQTDGYTDFMTITDIKDVDEIHNGTDSQLPMFTSECIYALYGDKPNLANFGLTDVAVTDGSGNVFKQGNGSVQSNWDYTNWSQTGKWGDVGTAFENSHDIYDDVVNSIGNVLDKHVLPKQQFWLNTRAAMHAAAVTAANTAGGTDEAKLLAYRQSLQDQSVKSYITREQFDAEFFNQSSTTSYAQTQGLPGSNHMGWDEARIGNDYRKITRARDGKVVYSGLGLPTDSPAFRCYRISNFVNCTSLNTLPSPTTFTATVGAGEPAGYGQAGDATLLASHPLYPKTNAFIPPSDPSFLLAGLAERYTPHLYRDSDVQAPVHGKGPLTYEDDNQVSESSHQTNQTTLQPLYRWQKYLYPLFKASTFIDKEAQLKLTLKSDVKKLQRISLIGFNFLNQAKSGFQMQHKGQHHNTDFIVLRIKEVEGGVISNNPNIQGAFAVLPNNSLTNFDDGSYESSMYEPEQRGIAMLDLAEGQQSVRHLTFELKDRFGNDVVMTGRAQLWLRLHCLCG